MNTITVVAYCYNGAIHCTNCAEHTFGLDSNLEIHGRGSDQISVIPIYLGEKLEPLACKTCSKIIRFYNLTQATSNHQLLMRKR